MTDFLEAFQQGQRAAKQSGDANAEIDAVLQLFKAKVLEATGGKLQIYVAGLPDILGFGNLVNLTNAITKPPAPGRAAPKAIYARNIQSSNTTATKLAHWLRPHEGYPCTISFNNQEIGCHDRDGLERGLAAMLQDAWVGEQLQNLLAQPSQLPTSTEGDDTSHNEPPKTSES
jgi:hypothetical protein